MALDSRCSGRWEQPRRQRPVTGWQRVGVVGFWDMLIGSGIRDGDPDELFVDKGISTWSEPVRLESLGLEPLTVGYRLSGDEGIRRSE